jgi:hypothetical protein
MSEINYIKLTGAYYFDPVKKHILKKQGSSFTFVMHDRRIIHRPVARDRRSRLEAIPIHLKPIIQGLYWDAENKHVYKKIGGNFVLYSKDRRRIHGPSPTGSDRRKAHH